MKRGKISSMIVVALLILARCNRWEPLPPLPENPSIFPAEYAGTILKSELSSFVRNEDGSIGFRADIQMVTPDHTIPYSRSTHEFYWNQFDNPVSKEIRTKYENYFYDFLNGFDTRCEVSTMIIDGPFMLCADKELYGKESGTNLAEFTRVITTGGYLAGPSFEPRDVGIDRWDAYNLANSFRVGDWMPSYMYFPRMCIPDFAKDYNFMLTVPVQRVFILNWIKEGQPYTGPTIVRDTLRAQFQVKAREES